MKTHVVKKKKDHTFNAEVFLDSAGVARRIVECQQKDTIFAQGDLCKEKRQRLAMSTRANRLGVGPST
jgi:hypothetical protein